MLARVFWGRDEMVKLRRKIVKRPCMTYLYSCQSRTMSKALLKDFRSEPGFADLKPFLCYWLCSRIYKACREEMPIATKFMDLMIEVGVNEYHKKKDFALEMPITKFLLTQKYRDNIIERLEVKYKKRTIRLNVIVGKGDRLDFRKIVNATSPNWVHGLDGQIVAKILLDAGYTVSAIHDSFSTHCCDAGKLYKDARIAMHHIFSTYSIYDFLKLMNFDLEEYRKFKIEQEKEKAAKEGREPREIRLWDGELGDLDLNELFKNQYCFS